MENCGNNEGLIAWTGTDGVGLGGVTGRTGLDGRAEYGTDRKSLKDRGRVLR
jgi:hypothetical protein